MGVNEGAPKSARSGELALAEPRAVIESSPLAIAAPGLISPRRLVGDVGIRRCSAQLAALSAPRCLEQLAKPKVPLEERVAARVFQMLVDSNVVTPVMPQREHE